jgi:hypothetical protein
VSKPKFLPNDNEAMWVTTPWQQVLVPSCVSNARTAVQLTRTLSFLAAPVQTGLATFVSRPYVFGKPGLRILKSQSYSSKAETGLERGVKVLHCIIPVNLGSGMDIASDIVSTWLREK